MLSTFPKDAIQHPPQNSPISFRTIRSCPKKSIRALRLQRSEERSYEYEEHGGTALAASACGIDHHHVIKTLIMEDENAKPLVILMHGDCEVSTKNLARQIGAKHVSPCKPEQAQRNSGYFVGGTSPFGTKKHMPVYVESSILELDKIFINGGRRGYQVGIDPKVLTDVLGAKPVNCANPD